MLTVVCFKYAGYRANVYTAAHVNAWALMFSRFLTIPHRCVCITDDPTGIRCETIPMIRFPEIANVPKGRYDNYRKLIVFGVSEVLGERLLVTDLDILVRKNIDDLITDHDLKIIKGEYSSYNSSFFLLRGGAHKEVWSSFKPHSVERTLERHRRENNVRELGTDQAWIGYCVKNAELFNTTEVQRALSCNGALPKVVYFSGDVKPWSKKAKARMRRFHMEYMRFYTP